MKKELRHYWEILHLDRRRKEYKIDREVFVVSEELNKYRGKYNYFAYFISFMVFSTLLTFGEEGTLFSHYTIQGVAALILLGVGVYVLQHCILFGLFLKKDANKLQKKYCE